MSSKDFERLGEAVSNRLATCELSTSPDYFTLTNIFKQAKLEFKGKRCDSSTKRLTSPATLAIQQRFSAAIAQRQRERTDFSYFVVDNLEKLLNAQYEHEKEVKQIG